MKWKPLIISILISLGVGFGSWLLTSDSMEMYREMYRPPLSPPAIVFPIVWTILFVLMGIAAYRIYISDSLGKKEALRLYGVQLLANAGWTIIFFHFQAYLVAFAWILLLWYLIFLTYQQFKEIDELAGKLLLPYLIWVTFAAYLNLAIAVHYFF